MPSRREPKPTFSGFFTPRSTQVPDNFFDAALADLSGAETKVLLYIFRRTFGFKKDADNISLSQMVHGIRKKNGEILDRGTGLGKGTVARALASLVEKRMVRKTRRRSPEKGDQATSYQPILADETPLSQNRTGGVPKMNRGLSQDRTHKGTGDKQQVDKTVNGAESPVRYLPDLEQPREKTALIAQDILDELGDGQSLNFYRLAARKTPEQMIRKMLAEIRADGTDNPPRAFTYRVNQYALGRLKMKVGK